MNSRYIAFICFASLLLVTFSACRKPKPADVDINVDDFDVVDLPVEIDNPQDDEIHPLSLVAEYLVGKEAGSFALSHDNDASGYYSYSEASSACPQGYHLPSRQEAAVLFPLFGPNNDIYVWFDLDTTFYDVSEVVKIGNVQASFESDFISRKGSSVAYALRFKKGEQELEPGYPASTDNRLLTAYRYEVKGTHQPNNKKAHLEVRARLVGNDFNGTILDIAQESFWQAPSDKELIRIIPSAIYFNPQTNKEIFGMGGYLWTSTPHEKRSSFTWTISYIFKMAYLSYNSQLLKLGILPFRDSE